MLRYVKMKHQTVIEFCCSRVVFRDVVIPISSVHLLFDNDFIYNTFNKFKRPSSVDARLLPKMCSKCEGHGFYDWVSRLTDDGKHEFVYTELSQPLIVKNENPISVIYVSTQWNATTFYYPTNFIPTQLTYRCEKCFGSGFPLTSRDTIHPITIDHLEKRPLEQAPQAFQKQSILKRITTYIKGVYNNETSKRISQRY